MSDELKNRIEKFLAMCLKTKAENKDNDANTIDLPEEQHRELAQDAVAITNSLLELHRLLPISYKLAELGYMLEAQGKIKVEAGEAYDEAALNFFYDLYGSTTPFSTQIH